MTYALRYMLLQVSADVVRRRLYATIGARADAIARGAGYAPRGGLADVRALWRRDVAARSRIGNIIGGGAHPE